MKNNINDTKLMFEQKNLPTIPQNPIDISKFLNQQVSILNVEKSLLNCKNISVSNYKIMFEYIQKHAEIILDAELILADVFKNMANNQTTQIKNTKTKAQKIYGQYGLTKAQYIQIQRLNEDSVNKAKEIAKKEARFVNRSDALRLVQKKHKEENTKVFNTIGVYETSYLPTHNKDIIENPINYCVLFANVGIGECYLEENGFHAMVANEYLPERAKWYKELYPNCNVIQGDINYKIDEIIEAYQKTNCQMLLTSPPCQTFSLAGKRDFSDPRTNLFIPTLKIIEKVMPKYIVIENVKEFLNASPEELKGILGKQSIGSYVKQKLESLGYIVNVDVCDCADYGTAQSRKRAIFFASLKGLWKFPKKDKYRIALFEVIGDLPSLEAGEKSDIHPLHYAPTLPECQVNFLRHTPSGCSAHANKDEWKPVNVDGSKSNAKHDRSFARKDWAKPSSTITSEFRILCNLLINSFLVVGVFLYQRRLQNIPFSFIIDENQSVILSISFTYILFCEK